MMRVELAELNKYIYRYCHPGPSLLWTFFATTVLFAGIAVKIIFLCTVKKAAWGYLGFNSLFSRFFV